MVVSIIKVIAVIGFNILAIIIVTGGVPGQPYIGAKIGRVHKGTIQYN